MFNNIFKNKKGVTLVELLVSIAILGIVAAPFMGSFLTATRNNVLAERKLIASNLAQKAMDEIKADPDLLAVAAPDWNDFSDDGDYYIEYKLASNTDGNVSIGDNFTSPEDENDIDIDVEVSSRDSGSLFVKFKNDNTEYDLISENTLNINKSDGLNSCEYIMNSKIETFTPTEVSNPTIDIRIKFNSGIKSTDNNFVLDINSQNSPEVPYDVNVYILDDENNKLKLSSSGKSINTYKSLDNSSNESDITNVLYDIYVRVLWKDDDTQILDTINSMVKK